MQKVGNNLNRKAGVKVMFLQDIYTLKRSGLSEVPSGGPRSAENHRQGMMLIRSDAAHGGKRVHANVEIEMMRRIGYSNACRDMFISSKTRIRMDTCDSKQQTQQQMQWRQRSRSAATSIKMAANGA